MKISKRTMLSGCFVAVLLTMQGCANMSDRDTRMVTGAAIGTAAGAIIDRGGAGGVLAGAAIGTASGWLYDHYKKHD